MEHSTGAFAATEILTVVVVILVTAFLLHLAAGFLTDNPPFIRSVLVAVLGTVVAGLLVFLLPEPWGLILAVISWLAVAATIYRIGLFRAFLLGLLAYLLYVVIRVVIRLIAAALGVET
jgi:hypothetical protein